MRTVSVTPSPVSVSDYTAGAVWHLEWPTYENAAGSGGCSSRPVRAAACADWHACRVALKSAVASGEG